MRSVIYLTVFMTMTVVSVVRADLIRELWVKTTDANNCGMTGIVGQLSAKVCGQGLPTNPSGRCCVAVHLQNQNDNFQEGEIDYFEGRATLGECYDFDLGTLSSLDTDITVVLYHDGTDGGCFDFVRVRTNDGFFYECLFDGIFMDGTSFLRPSSCSFLSRDNVDMKEYHKIR